MMNTKELRQKTAADLQKELIDLRREQFNLRMSRATGQAAKPDQFSKVRRNIARLKTVMWEQRNGVVVKSAESKADVKAPAAKTKGKAKTSTRKTTRKAKSA
jgi:large subunit ribosomal protein L29